MNIVIVNRSDVRKIVGVARAYYIAKYLSSNHNISVLCTNDKDFKNKEQGG